MLRVDLMEADPHRGGFYNGRRGHLMRTDLFSKCAQIFSVFSLRLTQ